MPASATPIPLPVCHLQSRDLGLNLRRRKLTFLNKELGSVCPAVNSSLKVQCFQVKGVVISNAKILECALNDPLEPVARLPPKVSNAISRTE